jgi:hypothetical protein
MEINQEAVPELMKQLEMALIMLKEGRHFGEDWQIHPNYVGIYEALKKAELK